ncbi:aromatic-ring-hydroxylating dioxygenase subunit beta [Rhodospirillaceae bacterium KN72]|uniref:Aromatic-ring-hydroxylating dioxygenase subunit beta n=1 Tax=Pacificispira spongiicola TaxID=2729598 RepID=A0A7Y0HHB2_9PROT|nr:aromatic-ring-hydroxylating dioxygenase subunit beta [Pacificispira spongiicola]NMM46538.1 aromatic-ring-hydroxylating dioxygenase subunit beta [Pacificispira spongiicola]
MTNQNTDPSTSSYYVTDAFYEGLMRDFDSWDDDALRIDEGPNHVRASAMLKREARYLDQGRYQDWLSLFAAECAYWIPGTWHRGDPRREIAFAFHDRRQLEDRVYRLETGFAWSQTPASRTSRMVSNIEVFSTRTPGIFMVRSNFHTTEFWNGEMRFWIGNAVHRLYTHQDGTMKILAKQVNLLNCDENIRNPSITL